MFGEDINYFRSEYDKNILIYGRETIYEPLDISYEELSYHLRQQKQIGLPVNSVCFGVKIGLKISVGVILIFERISFTTANVPLLKKLFEDTQDEFGEKLVSGIFFIDCQFSTPLAIDKPIDVDVCFRNCVFKRDLIVANNINTNVIFNNCKFRNKFEFKDIQINNMFYVENCLFYDSSLVNLSRTTFNEAANCVMENNQFCGKFEAENTKIEGNAKFINLAFFSPFKINSLKLSENCVFQNFAFYNANSKAMLDAQEKFAHTLRKNKYLLEIEALGLNTNKQNVGFNDSNYQQEIASGYLKISSAAEFLGMSKDNLAKKRMADKRQITRESIPYVGEGKSIAYPLDALKAFKASDWALLKELREKYAKNESANSDSE